MAAGPIHKVATLGTIVSSAPQAALLEALRQLRPQFDTALEEIPGDFGPAKHYRVTVGMTGDASSRPHVSPWLSSRAH